MGVRKVYPDGLSGMNGDMMFNFDGNCSIMAWSPAAADAKIMDFSKLRTRKKEEARLSFERCYEEYHAPIYKFIYGLLGNSEEAEEITQETFTKLYRCLARSAALENPRAWLYRVAANTCCTLLKRRAKYRQIMEENIHPQLDETGSDTTAEEAIKKEEIAIMRSTIETLPPRDRVVLMLYQSGFSYARMAKIVGVKKSHIGVIISRAIDKLHRSIKRGGKG